MSIIVWVVFGLTAGFVATRLFGSRGGLFFDLILGVVGSVVGGFLFHLFGATGIDGFTIWSLLVAVVGACVLLGAKRLIQERMFA